MNFVLRFKEIFAVEQPISVKKSLEKKIKREKDRIKAFFLEIYA